MSLAQQKSAAAPTDPTDDVTRRLEQIEQKVDALRRQLEGHADRDWGAIEAARRHAPGLSPVASAFVEALARRNAAWAEIAVQAADTPWTVELESQTASTLDPLWERLMQLAERLVVLTPTSPPDIRVKALALKEFCEQGSDDIVHRLAASLAADLLGGEA